MCADRSPFWTPWIARIALVIGLTACAGSFAIALQPDMRTAERLTRLETQVESMQRQASDRSLLDTGIIIAVASNLILSGLRLRGSKP